VLHAIEAIRRRDDALLRGNERQIESQPPHFITSLDVFAISRNETPLTIDKNIIIDRILNIPTIKNDEHEHEASSPFHLNAWNVYTKRRSIEIFNRENDFTDVNEFKEYINIQI